MTEEMALQVVSESEGKKIVPRLRPLNKRAHSSSPVTLRSKIVPPSKSRERRCQSLTPSVLAIEKPIEVAPIVPDGIDVTDLPPPYSLDNESEGIGSEESQTLPPNVLSKMLRTLATKKREFIKLRKSFIAQQNAMLETFAQLREMERRAGVPKDDSVGDVRVLSVSGWPAHDLLLLIRDDISIPLTDEIGGSLGPNVLHQFSAQLNSIPGMIVSVCTEIMEQRLEVLNSFKSKTRTDKTCHNNNLDRKSKSLEFDADTEKLHRLVTKTAENLKAKISYVYELAKISWVDRDILAKKLERIQKENLTLQNKLEELIKKENEMHAMPDGAPNYQNLREELEKERAARETLKDVVSSAESMLRVARARIATLERQLKDTRAELEATRKKQKELEQLNRTRESSFDARSKKLREASKTGEITIETLSRQRDALELRVKELREQVEQTELTVKQREGEQRSRIECLQAKLAAQERIKSVTDEHVKAQESKIKELEQQLEAIKEHSSTLVIMERKHYLDYVPSKENEPSDRELELWKELEEARSALSHMEEELRQSRADKDNLLDSLSRIAQEGSNNVQEKIAAELLDREQNISQLKRVIKNQKENMKSMNQNITQYELQMLALRHEVKRLRNYDTYAKEIPHQELQTELLALHMEVDSLNRERTALVTAAASRALMLERHERSAELFARLVRARRGLTAILDGRNTPLPLNNINHEELSSSLSTVCTSAAETWSALHSERTRVLQLESAVVAQTLQLEREAQVRTKLEKQRAMLEKQILRGHHSLSLAAHNKQISPWNK